MSIPRHNFIRLAKIIFILAVLGFICFHGYQIIKKYTYKKNDKVLHIVDGDTLWILGNNEIKIIRMIGYDAPELEQSGYQSQCHAAESTRQLKQYFEKDQSVILQQDIEVPNIDKFGRYLRYIHLPDGQDLGKKMLAGGFGRELTVHPYQRREDYVAVEKEAIFDQKGIWNPKLCP